jgi:radical SAM-linked protein
MPRIDFGPALPVGVESLAEFFDLESFGYLDASEVLEGLQSSFPQDIVCISCEEIPIDAPPLFKGVAKIHYEIRIPEEMELPEGILYDRAERFRQMATCVIRRKRGDKVQELDVRAMVDEVKVSSPCHLLLTVHPGPEGGVRLMELAGALLGLEEGNVRRLRITKTAVEFHQPPT